MRVLGVDGCKHGWIGISLVDGHFDAALTAGRLADLMNEARDASVIGVDIPLGAEATRYRRVDLDARRFVGPRWSSVFLVPPQQVLTAASYDDACARSRELTGSAPSKQTWELRKKILEADDLASTDARLIEVHPEVSFRALVGAPLAPKKTWSGMNDRRLALERVGIQIPSKLGHAGDAAPDDVLDAAVVAWSAHRHANGASVHLDPVLVDAGRQVTIWY